VIVQIAPSRYLTREGEKTGGYSLYREVRENQQRAHVIPGVVEALTRRKNDEGWRFQKGALARILRRGKHKRGDSVRAVLGLQNADLF